MHSGICVLFLVNMYFYLVNLYFCLWLGGGGPGQGESLHQEPEGVQDHLSRLQGSTTFLFYRGQDTQVMGVSGMNEWMDGSMNEWMNERMNGWLNKWMNEWMDEWMDEWINGWLNEWIN